MNAIEEKCLKKGVRLTDQRKVIAKNGKLKYMKYFNSTVVAEYIINKTFDNKNKKNKYIWENK